MQVSRVASWLFNEDWEYFGVSQEQAVEKLMGFSDILPNVWQNPDPHLEPLYPTSALLESLVGISGLAGAGKDTCAVRLIQRGYQHESFARPLKLLCKALFGWTDEHVNGRLKEIVDPAWEFSPRQAMQRLGTEGVRDCIGADFWIKSLKLRLSGRVVVSDVRFPNEADFILGLGQLWRVERRQRLVMTNALHSSETALVDFCNYTHVLRNDASIAELWADVDKLLHQ